MTALLGLPVEGLHHVKPVFRVDAEQRQQHEADRATFVGAASFHFAPQGDVDAADGVFAGSRFPSFHPDFLSQIAAFLRIWGSPDGLVMALIASWGAIWYSHSCTERFLMGSAVAA